MSKINNFQEFVNEEGLLKDVVITIGTLLSLGLSKADAQYLRNNQQALSIIDTCNKYNQSIKQKTNLHLSDIISDKVKNSQMFIQNYVRILPDKTIVISPDFVKGLKMNVNPDSKEYFITYSLKF